LTADELTVNERKAAKIKLNRTSNVAWARISGVVRSSHGIRRLKIKVTVTVSWLIPMPLNILIADKLFCTFLRLEQPFV